MDEATFKQVVLAEGFSEPVPVSRDPDGFVDLHTHPFEAKALILEGYIDIGWAEKSNRYQPGDVFHLNLSEPHWERYGPQGVVYLSARRSPP